MGTKAEALLQPGSCLNKAADDEPVFILRAKDPLAAQTVRLWASMASIGAHENSKIDKALDVAGEMEHWHRLNFPQPGDSTDLD